MFPRMLSIVPGARAVRRSCRFDDKACFDIFNRPLSGALFNLPRLLVGAQFGSSIVTNGVSISIPYIKARTAEARREERELNAGDYVDESDTSNRSNYVRNGGGSFVPGSNTPSPHRLLSSRARIEYELGARPLSKQERIVVVDAGGTWIVMTLEIITDPITGQERERVIGLSRKEWRALRKDDERLKLAHLWCKDLAAPGGAFERLQGVSRKTALLEKNLEYCRVAHGVSENASGRARVNGAYDEVLRERLKLRWARAAFRTWSIGNSILMKFWARIRAGRLDDGTAGVRPVILYGRAKFNASGPGRQSAPTTTMRAACEAACGV